MKSDDFEKRMRRGELYHQLRVLDNTWIVLRIDGRKFSKFTESRFDKPFDLRMHSLMSYTTETLVKKLHAVYGYTESDEISLLFKPDWTLFDREVEKLVSVSAGLASSAFVSRFITNGATSANGLDSVLMDAAEDLPHFDSRIWVGTTQTDVVDYFRWRQADATRCALNGWAYWTLRKNGDSAGKATTTLNRQSVSFKHDLLFQNGINFNNLPMWQRRGTGIYWQTYQKLGHNPKLNIEVKVERSHIYTDTALPIGDGYDQLLLNIMNDRIKQ